jgi:hypothetical protein
MMEGDFSAIDAALQHNRWGFGRVSSTIRGRGEGGSRALFFATIFLTIISAEEPALNAETISECAQRIKILASQNNFVEEKSGSLLVPIQLLKNHPLLLRNLIATIYNNPYLAAFFRGFENAPQSLHYLKRAYELPTEIMRMDRDAAYSYEELVALLQTLGGNDGYFDLDFSKADREGVYLRFLDPETRSEKGSEPEKKLRRQFADALVKKIASTGYPIPFKSIKYVPAGQSFLIESAFFLSRARREMHSLVTSELALTSWKPFLQPFQRRFDQSKFAIRLSDACKCEVHLLRRRAHPTQPKQFLYEVVMVGEGAANFKGELLLNGQNVEWHEGESDFKLGIVSLPEFDGKRSLEVEIRSIGAGKVVEIVSVESHRD